jgi:hypothetical protein
MLDESIMNAIFLVRSGKVGHSLSIDGPVTRDQVNEFAKSFHVLYFTADGRPRGIVTRTENLDSKSFPYDGDVIVHEQAVVKRYWESMGWMT